MFPMAVIPNLICPDRKAKISFFSGLIKTCGFYFSKLKFRTILVSYHNKLGDIMTPKENILETFQIRNFGII